MTVFSSTLTWERGPAALMLIVFAAMVPMKTIRASSVILDLPTASGGPLAGTLELAAPSSPIVLVVPGAGPTDRDGNSPVGVKAAPYRALAEALVSRSVSSVRFDKRGLSAVADPMLRLYQDPPIAEAARDVEAWIHFLANREHHCVYLAGHSEGGLVALVAAKVSQNSICGLILISTPGQNIAEIVKRQIGDTAGNESFSADAQPVIASLRAGNLVDVSSRNVSVQEIFSSQRQLMWRDLFAYNPEKLIRAYKGRVLILQGDNDLQLATENAVLLHSAHRGSQMNLIHGMNHVLKIVSANKISNALSYGNPSLPVSHELADRIASFVNTSH